MAEQRSYTLAEMTSATPESMASLLLMGHAFYQQGKWAEARDIFEGVALLDVTNPYPHGILGPIHQQSNQFELAIEWYSRALYLHPYDINTLTNRGECSLHLGRFHEAAEDFKRAILLDKDGKNQAAIRARFLAVVTLEALKLAEQHPA